MRSVTRNWPNDWVRPPAPLRLQRIGFVSGFESCYATKSAKHWLTVNRSMRKSATFSTACNLSSRPLIYSEASCWVATGRPRNPGNEGSEQLPAMRNTFAGRHFGRTLSQMPD